jgi:predicted metalloendopeptidase
MIYTLNKLNNSVDPDDWADTKSYIVNAYFNPTRNEIIFPAAILQPPFLDLNKSDIYNYGNLGGVIGHEIIHGFDDQGSKFDDKGNMYDWWTERDRKNYQTRVDQIIKAYDDQGINGRLTVGENIADFGAVNMPLYALSLKLNRELTNKEIREFYISFATHWQYLLREEAAYERILSDPHAFADLRVNVPLANQKLFQSVFNIKPGDDMYIDPKDMLTIW